MSMTRDELTKMHEQYERDLRDSRVHWHETTQCPQWSFDEAKVELEYIQSVNPVSPGENFNHDPNCFATYCRMQERQIYQSGFPLLTMDVENCRLIAERMRESIVEGMQESIDGAATELKW